MEPVYNYKDLHDSVINLGEMAAKASRAIQTVGEMMYRYCLNDVIATSKCYLYALPNNKRKSLGLPLKRPRAYKKSKRNESRR